MRVVDRAAVRQATPWPELITAIADVLATEDGHAPDRHVHEIGLAGGNTGSLLLMPSWITHDVIGVKTVTYVPTNAGTDVPTVIASFQLFDGVTGELLAVIDGEELTARRTAAISALAARSLARTDSSRLLVMGTGQLAPNMARAHSQVRPIESVEVWGRNGEAAESIADQLRSEGLPASATTDPERSAAGADIISCVTGATDPIVHGAWLSAGTHLDLVGSFRPDMCEADETAITQATVFVDTMAGAIQAGDLARPLAAGMLAEQDIAADLRSLATGGHGGRTSDEEFTVFKCAGFALADLAAAKLIHQSA